MDQEPVIDATEFYTALNAEETKAIGIMFQVCDALKESHTAEERQELLKKASIATTVAYEIRAMLNRYESVATRSEGRES